MSQVLKRLLLIGASFVLGLFVFYIPEKTYRQLEEVWLPPSSATKRMDSLFMPVRGWRSSERIVRFGPDNPSGPQIALANAAEAPACSEMFYDEELKTQACRTLGKMRVAIGNAANRKEAEEYLSTFRKVARRDVAGLLGQNRRHVSEIVLAMREQRDTQTLSAARAYKHLPFGPVMPATLPANWTQYQIKISGDDALHPTRVDIFYHKGRERSVIVTLVPSRSFRIDTVCGPTPDVAGQYIPCNRVANEEYFVGGQNDGKTASWFAYRHMGDVVAISQVSAYAQGDYPPVLLNRDLEVQASIIKSLHPVDEARLKGAVFSGAFEPSYPLLGL